MIRAYMPEQHRLFFEALPWLLVGVLDESGHSMALALTGAPGFINTPTAFTMTIAPHQALDPGDTPAGARGLEFAGLSQKCGMRVVRHQAGKYGSQAGGACLTSNRSMV